MNNLIHDLELIVSAGLMTLIWIIQFLHYPSFVYYDENQFENAMLFHQKRISYIVVPFMIVELILSIYHHFTTLSLISTLSLSCVIIIWLSTFFLQVPLHSKLSRKEMGFIHALIKSNYIRTFFWTAKLALIELERI